MFRSKTRMNNMQFHVIEDTGSRFQAELDGADNTICNVLLKEVWKQPGVVHAAYNIEHPLVGKPKLFVEVSKGDAKKVLADACKALEKIQTALRKQVSAL